MDLTAGWGDIAAIVGAIWGLGSIGAAIVIWAALVASKGPRRARAARSKRPVVAAASRPTPVAETARIGAEALRH